jgi:prophage regulatory protein
MENQNTKPRRILRANEVFGPEGRTGQSRVTGWRGVRAGTFPAPVQLGPNSVGWYEDEIDKWIAERPRQTYGATAPAAA